MTRPQPDARSAYARFVPLTTRWMDNDVYGHLNNVVCHSLFDTAVNSLLIEAGVRVTQPGRSSVCYEIGLFAEGSDACAAR